VTIRGLQIIDAYKAIRVLNSPKTTVQNVLVDTTASVGVLIDTGSPQSEVRGSSFSHTGRDAIRFLSHQGVARDNTISQTNYDGIFSQNTHQIKISDNTITGAYYGIRLIAVANATVTDNTLNFNRAAGLGVFGGGANTASNNTAKGNFQDGIFTFDSTANTFKKNLLQGNSFYDAEDWSTGSGTAGTANTWTGNKCALGSPAGLCAAPATQP
jgi:parallel beta-helix repeat protein